MQTYLTLSDNNYVKGVVALYKSLKKHTDKSLLCLYYDLSLNNIKLLENLGIKTKKINSIENPNQNYPIRFKYVYTKIVSWSLTEFSKVVFIDSDCLVLQNIDSLFDIDGFAAAPDHGIGLNPNRLNSGVMVINPDINVYNNMINSLKTIESYDKSDQGFLNGYFKNDWKKLDYNFNCLKRIYVHHPNMFNLKNIKILHFVGEKPWDFGKEKDYVKYLSLYKIWREYYIQ